MSGFVTTEEVQALTGKPSRRSTEMWLRQSGLERFQHPVDRRKIVVRRADIEAVLSAPQPIRPVRGVAAA